MYGPGWDFKLRIDAVRSLWIHAMLSNAEIRDLIGSLARNDRRMLSIKPSACCLALHEFTGQNRVSSTV